MSIVLPTDQELRAAEESIVLRFEREFIERKDGKTKIVSAHPLHHDPHLSQKSKSITGSKKPKIIDVLHKDKEVIIHFLLIIFKNELIIDKAFDGDHLEHDNEDQINKDFHIVIGRERQNMVRRNERRKSVFSVTNQSVIVKLNFF